MADGVNIDWNAAPPPVDVVGNYLNAFKTGQSIGKATSMQNANARFARYTQDGGDEPLMGRASSAGPVQQQGPAPPYSQPQPTQAPVQATHNAQANGFGAAPQPGPTGDVDALRARLDGVPPAQHAAAVATAQDKNEQLAHILLGLKGYPPEQRLAIAQHLAQQTGLMDPNHIGAGDVSDQGINSHLATTMSIEQMLKQQMIQRYGASAREQQLAPGQEPHQPIDQYIPQYYPHSGKVE